MIFIRRIQLLLAKQYTSIGGQAVLEGVMMRSPNAFVVAVRKSDGSIQIRRDQWFGLSQKLNFLKKPVLRGVLILIETMLNGVASLNYSANIAMEDEMREKARKKNLNEEEYLKKHKQKDKVDWSTFFTVISSIAMGLALFVGLPHLLALFVGEMSGQKWDLDSFSFHAVDGTFKAMIFLLYVYLIGFIPDIRRVFQYHGAEHKSISTFEAEEDLSVENAKKYTTLHPRCGTTFIFFLIFISIILFSIIFTFIPIGKGWGEITLFGKDKITGLSFVELARHLTAIVYKVFLMLPVAGVSYEIIKLAGKYPNNPACKFISYPGMMLQKLTTKEPDEKQLEVALASLKTALYLEEKYKLNEAKTKVIEADEINIGHIQEIEGTNKGLNDFLEA